SCPVGGPLYRMPRCGGPLETVLPGTGFRARLVDAGDYLYVAGRTEEAAHSVLRVRKSDLAASSVVLPAKLRMSPSRPFGANASHVFVLDDDGTLYRAAHVDSTFQVFSTVSTGESLVIDYVPGWGLLSIYGAVAASDSHVLWSTGVNVYRAPLDGTSAGARVEPQFGRVAQASFGERGGYFVASESIFGLTPQTVQATQRVSGLRSCCGDMQGSQRLLANGGWLFWRTPDLVSGTPESGGAAPAIMTGPAASFAVRGGRLYYVSLTGEWLLSRPATALPVPQAGEPASERYPIWQHRFGNASNRAFLDNMVVDATGAILANGYTRGPAELGAGVVPWAPPSTPVYEDANKAQFVVRYTAAGDYQWAVKVGNHEGTSAGLDETLDGPYSSLGVDATGASVVSFAPRGVSQPYFEQSRDSGPVELVKLSASGSEVWRRQFDFGWQLAVSPAGDIFINDHPRPQGANAPPLPQLLVKGMDAGANAKWSKVFTDLGVKVWSGPIAASATSVFAVANGRSANGTDTAALLKLDAPSGRGLWRLPLSGAWIASVALTPAGGAVVSGVATGYIELGNRRERVPLPGAPNIYLASVAADGTLAWIRFMQNASHYAPRIAVDGQSNVYVTGGPDSPLGTVLEPGSAPVTQFLARFDGAGRLRWIRHSAYPQIAAGTRPGVVAQGYQSDSVLDFAFTLANYAAEVQGVPATPPAACALTNVLYGNSSPLAWVALLSAAGLLVRRRVAR
ncbi:MAG TPA: hypothetical protein VK524_15865, partial [Polyangiaceae bacterium]|nr:hypothetical protein [Polyangiaceae bacterium]